MVIKFDIMYLSAKADNKYFYFLDPLHMTNTNNTSQAVSLSVFKKQEKPSSREVAILESVHGIAFESGFENDIKIFEPLIKHLISFIPSKSVFELVNKALEASYNLSEGSPVLTEAKLSGIMGAEFISNV